MTHHAKRSSTADHDGSGLLGSVLGRRSAAMPAVSRGSKGTGAPSSRRTPIALVTGLIAIAAFAITAAPASAAPAAAKMDTISNVSYASADVTGKASSPGGIFGLGTSYFFEYCTAECSEPAATWTASPEEKFSGPAEDKEVEGTIKGLKGGTEYFVRLAVRPLGEGEAISAKPYPSFTTLTADPTSVLSINNATDVAYTTATAKGEIDRPVNSDDVTCNFEYITDQQFNENLGNSAPGFQGSTPAPCDTGNPAETPGTVEATGHVPVEAKLAGLANDMTYHLRLAVSNANSSDAKEPASTFTTLKVDPPSVISIENASEVEYTQAQVKGIIERPATSDDPAFDVNCNFEAVTDQQFNDNPPQDKFAGAVGVACNPNPITAADTSPGATKEVEAALTGLATSTEYHLRLSGSNLGGKDSKEAAATFTTLAVPPPSVLSVANATGIDQDTAEVSGEVEGLAGPDPAFDVHCRYEYVTEASFQGNEEQSLRVAAEGGTYTIAFKGSSTAPLAFDAPPATIQAALAGLPGIGAGNVKVRGGLGSRFGVAPYLIVFDGALAGKDVEALTTDDGTLVSGAFTGGHANLLTSAEGGHAPGFVNPAPTDCEPLPAGGPQTAKVKIVGLLPDTTYHLRLTAENGGGTDTKDAAATFTTAPNFPASAVVGPITEVSYGGAMLSGESDAERGGSFLNAFEVSTDGVNWTHPTFTGGGGGVKLQPVDPVAITGLEGGTKYFVRLRVEGFYCDVPGAPVCHPILALSQPPYPSFTTLPVDPGVVLKADDATDVTSETAKVSGEIKRPANPDPAFDTNCRFEYVTDAQFDANGFQGAGQTPCGIDSLSTPEEKRAVEAELTGLKSGTKYHLRLTATNAGPDASLETPNTFTTVAVPATVTQTPGGSDGEAGYVLSGLVNPRNSTISDCKFVYGPDSELDYKKYAFAVDCSPMPAGQNEVQNWALGTGVPFRLTYHGQTTSGLVQPSGDEVESALQALPALAAADLSVTVDKKVELGITDYTVRFGGALLGTDVSALEVEANSAVSFANEKTKGNANTPVTVDGHVTGLTPGNEYHSRLVVTNAFGTVVTPDQGFVPTLDVAPNCPNEKLRKENSSEALPECRAYEQVTPQNKNSGEVNLGSYTDDGNTVAFGSFTNFGGAGNPDPIYASSYATQRSDSGWKLRANLDGPLRSYFAGPDAFASSPQPIGGSADLLSTLWAGTRTNDPATGGPGPPQDIYLRRPDGTFTLIGKAPPNSGGWVSKTHPFGNSDLSHVVAPGTSAEGDIIWGPGVYEFVADLGTQPRRVDVDNTGAPVCGGTTHANSISSDGRVIVVSPACESVWARINGTTSYDVSASRCDRIAPSACNAPSQATFVALTPDGSRVFFTTSQQLLNADTDQTKDIYACDLPTTPQTPVGKANSCADLIQISGARNGAHVENVLATSEDGSTVYFTARGVLADNEDALDNTAVAGDMNLYFWRQDEADPLGQTSFIAKLPDENVDGIAEGRFQSTADGRHMVFRTFGNLVADDTDSARDVYRYDAVSKTLTRVSFGTSGASGNAEGFDAEMVGALGYRVHAAVSNDGESIVFTTTEPLSPLDGNGNPDVYLWHDGRVSRISAGQRGGSPAAVSPSGDDILFITREQLIASDRDEGADVYDARVEGGFSQAEPERCSGETCQADATPAPAKQVPNSAQPGPGNPPPPKPCPKGKVAKHGKCIKKPHKKHSGKKHHHKKASHKQGGGK